MRKGAVCLALLFVLAFQPNSITMSNPDDTATPLKHVIIIVQENHSFDNYFGTYPTANGTLVDNITARLEPVDGTPSHVCLKYGTGCVSLHLTESPSPENPVEGQLAYENDYGASGFPESSGPQSMVYFDYHSIPAYWDYAEEYGLGDNYFSAVLSMTTPNRLMLLTGDTPVSENYGPPPTVQYESSVFRQLDAAGASWGYYDLLNSSQDPSSFYPLDYIVGLNVSGGHVRNVSSIFQELATGSGLPSVSYVNFLGNLALTEHPPFSPRAGEAQTVSVVNAVMDSPYWNSTAIFITYDEGGGFYDHVSPPSAFSIDHNFTDPLVGFGQRVPLLVVSAYSTVNYVSHRQLSHLSLLHFVEFNWKLRPLNQLVAGSSLPTDFFNFSQTPRAPILLGSANGSGITYPIPLQAEPTGEKSANPAQEPLGSLAVLAALVVVAVVAGVLLLRGPRTKGQKASRPDSGFTATARPSHGPPRIPCPPR